MKSPQQMVEQVQQALWQRFRSLQPAAPKPLPEEGRLVLGRDAQGLPFVLDSRLLSAHVDIVGGIGGGKTTAMRNLAWHQMETHPRLRRALIVIDPHGGHPDGLLRTTLRRIVETELYKRKKIFVIDGNSEYCTGLKVLTGEAEPAVEADHAIEAFERLQGDESFLEKPTLRRSLHGLLAVLSELGWSLAEADLLLDRNDPHGIRKWAIEQVNDRYAKKALLRLEQLAADPRLTTQFEIETIGTENRLAGLLATGAMRAIVGHQEINIREVLDDGCVLLVNTAGHNSASETAGDQLGKLVMRSVLFAAKRRRHDSLALILADECARYVSQDWERALAELRKYRVSICSAHQTFSMLGEPGDSVRDAIEKIPATKICFRLNSMQEAAALAPDLMQLNLEMPVETLIKPTMVAHKRVWLNQESAGFGGTFSLGHTRGMSEAQSETTTGSSSETRGQSYTKTESRSTTLSESETDGESFGESHSVGGNSSFSHTETEGEATGSSSSASSSSSSSRGDTSGKTQSTHITANSARSYGRTNTLRLGSVLGVPQPDSGTESRGSGQTLGRSNQAGRSEGQTSGISAGISQQKTRARAASNASGESWQDSQSYEHSRSRTSGKAWTEGESEAFGTSDAATKGMSHSHGATQGTSADASATISLGLSLTSGRSEALEPILKNLPSAVHNLESVRHMAAEMLCSLATGTCVVRTIKNGKIEGAVVRIPDRSCPPVSDERYADDLRKVMAESAVGKPMATAIQEIQERERKLIAQISVIQVVQEPERFRLPRPRRTGRAKKAKIQSSTGGKDD